MSILYKNLHDALATLGSGPGLPDSVRPKTFPADQLWSKRNCGPDSTRSRQPCRGMATARWVNENALTPLHSIVSRHHGLHWTVASTGHGRRTQSGSALLLVLFTLLLITGLILSALTFLESGVEDYGALNHQFRARQLARSGLAFGLNPQVTNQDTQLLNQKFKPNSEFHVVISSESTKLNINSLLEQQRDDILQTLFLQWNVPLKAVNDVINGLKKWTNGNQEIQPVGTNGQQAAPSQEAGIQTGQQQGIELVRPFMAVSEMAEVPGFGAVIAAKPDWANYFTVWSDGTIDVNLADPAMISLVTGVTLAQSTQLVRHIWGPDGIPFTSDDQPYQNWNDVMLQLGMSSQQFQIVQNLLSLSSSVDRVDSTGTIGNYSTTISVVAKRSSIPVAYLLWQEK
jgi:general secretion pathway protein K